jgi:hypothetical protein
LVGTVAGNDAAKARALGAVPIVTQALSQAVLVRETKQAEGIHSAVDAAIAEMELYKSSKLEHPVSQCVEWMIDACEWVIVERKRHNKGGDSNDSGSDKESDSADISLVSEFKKISSIVRDFMLTLRVLLHTHKCVRSEGRASQSSGSVRLQR